MAKAKPAKTTVKKTPAPTDVDPVHALVEHMLVGYTASTMTRGIRTGMNEAAVVKLLGKPVIVHRNEDMGEGRKLNEGWWERDVDIAGLAVREKLKVTWSTKPVARGVTNVGLTLASDAKAARVFNAASAELKTKLGAIYKKGENKSSFRAPGLALDDDEGFVAVFRYPAILILNAGTLE